MSTHEKSPCERREMLKNDTEATNTPKLTYLYHPPGMSTYEKSACVRRDKEKNDKEAKKRISDIQKKKREIVKERADKVELCVGKIDVYCTIRPFKRNLGTKVDLKSLEAHLPHSEAKTRNCQGARRQGQKCLGRKAVSSRFTAGGWGYMCALLAPNESLRFKRRNAKLKKHETRGRI